MNSNWMNQNNKTPNIGAKGANIIISIGEPSISLQYMIDTLYLKSYLLYGS
jgi:hypothetical protein